MELVQPSLLVVILLLELLSFARRHLRGARRRSDQCTADNLLIDTIQLDYFLILLEFTKAYDARLVHFVDLIILKDTLMLFQERFHDRFGQVLHLNGASLRLLPEASPSNKDDDRLHQQEEPHAESRDGGV